jgi:hypothetical protein
MKQITSLFIALVFMLSIVSVAFAQDVANETAAPVPELISEPVATTNMTTAEKPVPTLYGVKGGEEYSGLAQIWDRIKLAFTFQEEKKAELMNQIEARRQNHYDFLIANGKTQQAEKFKEKSAELKKNFDDWKAKRADKLAKLNERIANATNKNISEKRIENLNERVNKVEERVQNRTAQYEGRAAAVDQRLTERENQIEQRTQNKTNVAENESG